MKSTSGFHEWHKKAGDEFILDPTEVALFDRADGRGNSEEKSKSRGRGRVATGPPPIGSHPDVLRPRETDEIRIRRVPPPRLPQSIWRPHAASSGPMVTSEDRRWAWKGIRRKSFHFQNVCFALRRGENTTLMGPNPPQSKFTTSSQKPQNKKMPTGTAAAGVAWNRAWHSG